MRKINLQENKTSDSIHLSDEQLKELLQTQDEFGIKLSITPEVNGKSKYKLTSGSIIGAFQTKSLSVHISPKIAIKRLISLLCYAIGKVRFLENEFDFPEKAELPDALALAFVMAARKCFSRGLFHGYRIRNEALNTIRGRVRFADQVSRRSGALLPIEVRYDEYTDDILLNRLVKAAAWRLHYMLLRPEIYRQLAQVMGILDGVEYVEFSPKNVPDVEFNHLNEHYRVVVTLAQIILRNGAFEANRGEIRASGFVVDMARVFQDFVTVALRNSLKVAEYEKFGEYQIDSLDLGGSIKFRLPDLSQLL